MTLGAWFVAGPLSSADTVSNPYQPIVLRNPFGIKPVPEPVAQIKEGPPVALPKVILTGITTMFGPPKALIEITEAEPGKAANIRRPILREGEKDGTVEVLSIDAATASVRIKNSGFETNLNFEVAKSGSIPAGGPPPLASGLVAPNVPPVPGAMPGAHPAAATATLPGMNAPGGNGNVSMTYNNTPGRAGSSVTTYGANGPGDKPLPLRVPRTDVPGYQPNSAANALQEAARSRGLPIPPLPPTR
jgi:hypothetical protein